MHWVIQRGVLSPANVDRLLDALIRAELPHSIVTIPDGERRMLPDIDPSGPIVVCGATYMAAIANARKWAPGSFLNDNFDHSIWVDSLGNTMLNAAATVTTVGELTFTGEAFVRPLFDNKAFDGQVFQAAEFDAWRIEHRSLADVGVLMGPTTEIFAEYRLFVVNSSIVTGSQYKRGTTPYISPDVDPDIIDFGKDVITTWQPADAFVIDIARTHDGCKVVEFNNINSAGFYACDVTRYVWAMEEAFG